LTVLIDSWAWIEFFQGSEAGKVVKGYIDDDQDIIISTINLAEVYRWILRYYNEKTAEEKRLAMKGRCSLIDVDEEIAVNAAKIKHNLKCCNGGFGFQGGGRRYLPELTEVDPKKCLNIP
jgi:predicted nucleic acid-binding protein